MAENSLRITSPPYSLEEFYKKHEFPQIVCAVGGYYGVRKEDTISDGQKLLLLFTKTSQVVVASNMSPGRPAGEQYYIPLSSSLWFASCDEYYRSTESDTPPKGSNHSQEFKTVGELLIKRKGSLPKVVRVRKTYKGKSEKSLVLAGDLIFPIKLLKRKQILGCVNSRKEVLLLERSCKGNFSIHPMDTKMHITDFIHRFSVNFPITVMVMGNSDHMGSTSSFSLSAGTILSLKESTTLQSYTYTTDIFGEKKYPLMEMPVSIPIKIQCIELANFDMRPLYNTIQCTYKNLKPSMAMRKVFSTEHGLYEEIHKEDGSAHVYDLERLSQTCESISGKVKGTEDTKKDCTSPIHAPVKMSSSFTEKHRVYEEMQKENGSPHIHDLERPSQMYESIPGKVKGTENTEKDCTSPTHAPSFTEKSPPLPPRNKFQHTDISKSGPVVCSRTTNSVSPVPNASASVKPYMSASGSKRSSATMPLTQTLSVPSDVYMYEDMVSPKACLNKPSLLPLPSASSTATAAYSKDENVAYLQGLSLDDVLQLLDNMNLGEHKKSFEDQQIDGEIIVHLDKAELVDLGVIKNLHQTRLLKLIDGSISAKKFQA